MQGAIIAQPAGGGASVTPHDLGAISGTVTPDLTNGSYQYCYLTANTTFVAPVTGAEGDSLTVSINYAIDAYTLDFDSTIRRASDSAATFPKTLTVWKSYLFKLHFTGGVWCLVSLIGGFEEVVD